MDSVPRVMLRAGHGLAGSADQGGHRQVTIIERERWDRLCRDLGRDVPPSARRANILIRGPSLAGSEGRVLRLGGCRVRILGETRPCERMDESCAGLRTAMRDQWGGGAYGEILDDAEISVGDPAGWDPPVAP